MENRSSVFPIQDKPVEFMQVSLDGEEKVKKKQPRRILHFSDGILEEYSTDEEEEQPLPPPVDPKTLTWGPWFWHFTQLAAWNTYSAADFCGENLAWFFGITTPKYQSAIDEFYRLKEMEEKEEENERRLKEKLEGLSAVSVSAVSVSAVSVSKVDVECKLQDSNVQKF